MPKGNKYKGGSVSKLQSYFRSSTALFGRRSNSNGRFRKPVSTELGDDLLTPKNNVATDIRYCYFDKRMPCPCDGRCRIDDRSCGANRDYFDNVYQREGDLCQSGQEEKGKETIKDTESNSDSGGDDNTLQ